MKITSNNVKAYWDIQNLDTKKDIDSVAKEFEAMFIRMILKEFRKTIPEGIFNSSFSSKMYLDMFDMQIAEKISESDSIGLKEYIKEAISKYNMYSTGK